MRTMHTKAWLSAALVFLLLAGVSQAQHFPAKPIVFVVPYAPGGNVNVSARILQAAIGDALGQPVIVENKPGAGGMIAGDYVARAEPDGQTLFVGSNGPVILGPMTMPNPAYQWDKVFAPVSSLAFATNMLLVNPALPINSVAELVAYARKNPGKLTLATDTAVSINHFLAELLRLNVDRLDRGPLSGQCAGHQRPDRRPRQRRVSAARQFAAAHPVRRASRAGRAWPEARCRHS